MTKYILKTQDFVHTELNNQTIWMNTTTSNFIELNETATFIANLLEQQTQTENEIVETICDVYDTTEAECSADVQQGLVELMNAGLIEIC